MMRSLVAPADLAETGEFTLRRNLSLEGLEEALTAGDVVWLDCVNPEDEEIRWLERVLRLHPAVVSDLRREDRRPSLLVYPEYLFLSLFQARVEKAMIASEEIHCVIGFSYFLTLRHEATTAVDSAYERAAQNSEYWRRGVTYFLYLTMQFIVDSYYPLIDRISNNLNKLEEEAMASGGKELQRSVFRLKQQLISLRQMVAPQREVISNVIGEERLSKTSENRDLFRHLYERVLRIYDVIDAQRDLASNVLDLIESQEAANLTSAVSRLTVLSMIFLPLTFLVGLFGLNFVTTSPELTIPISGAWVFALIIIFTLASGLLLGWYFKRKGWL
jgi:magnesium transporter